MKAENFCYWLQGCLELGNLQTLNEEQVRILRNHLNMVFAHDIDPKLGDKQHQEKLQSFHDNLEGRPPRFPPDNILRPSDIRIKC